MTQREISQRLVGPSYIPEQGTPREEDQSKFRSNQVSRKDDEVENLKVGLHDIDSAILYYFKEVIRPRAMVNGTEIEVPITYATPERWQTVQKEGFWRDKEGKKQLPIIIFKRDSLEKDRRISNKLDANNPHNYYVTHSKFSARNQYYRPNLKTNTAGPEKIYIVSTIPDYVKLTYSCVILTDYISQMNPIVEAINFASDSYWGDENRFKFQSFIDSFRTSVTQAEGTDRVVKTEFSIKMNGYILPDRVNSGPFINIKRQGITVSAIMEES